MTPAPGVLIDQISLSLWLTEKLIILIQSYDDRHRGRKRKQSCKTIHLLHTREPLCLHRANKIKSNESNLLAKVQHPIQSGIQTTSLQEIHNISVSFLHNTSSSETNTDNIFLRHNRAVSSTARYHLAGNILDEVKAKKNTFGRLSHKIFLGNNSLIIEEKFLQLVDDFRLDGSGGNGF